MKRKDLPQENIKLVELDYNDNKEENVRAVTLYTTVLKYLLKPNDYTY